MAREDENNGPRSDSRYEVLERRRWRCSAQDGDRRGLDCGLGEREPALGAALHVFANGAEACAFGDDRAESLVRGGGLEHHLAADGEADPANPAASHFRSVLQPGDCGVDVIRVVPAEHIRVAPQTPSTAAGGSPSSTPMGATSDT